MCGIVGYIGKQSTVPILLEGLAQLEYRGYDSMGMACYDQASQSFFVTKVVGGIDQLKQAAIPYKDYFAGISHSRWATHGGVTTHNAHPHFDCSQRIAVVHNGIIENFADIKKLLLGHTFASETDTEVVAHFLEQLLEKHTLKDALTFLVAQLKGAFSLVILIRDYPHLIIAIRKRSPLCVGYTHDGIFVASDPQAFAHHTQQVIFMEDETFALLGSYKQEFWHFDGTPSTPHRQIINSDNFQAHKEGFSHFMLKEIYEQKRVIQDTVSYMRSMTNEQLLKICDLLPADVESLREIVLIGCGTSYHAALISKYFFEEFLNIPTRAYLASEYRFNHYFPNKNRITFFLSQSGETADTLEALRLCNSYQEKTIAITNIPASTITREAQGTLFMQAKREISVASTKCFTAQCALLYAVAAQLNVHSKATDMQEYFNNLLLCAEYMELALEAHISRVQKLAPFYASHNNFIFLGRAISYAFALEATLKLKEIAYKFVDCYPAGELKHGHIALLEPGFPVFIFSVLDEAMYHKLVANAQEVKARGAHLTVFAFAGQQELISLADEAFIFTPLHSPLAICSMIEVMQYLMFEIAKVLDRPIDKPRNLAKSVTVE